MINEDFDEYLHPLSKHHTNSAKLCVVIHVRIKTETSLDKNI